eukprot:gb/GECG01011769.1/.p1 GENE.gb/GECG01011769.1/~~gb/GECG01011769.1/.p1  ORF type:complete len:549 (+),score=71.72 gb/GECG01011769.1/:1-1647(+)
MDTVQPYRFRIMSLTQILVQAGAEDNRQVHQLKKQGCDPSMRMLCVPISLPTRRDHTIVVLQVIGEVGSSSFSRSDREALETFCYEAGVAMKKLSVDMVFAKMSEEAHEVDKGYQSALIPGKSMMNRRSSGSSSNQDDISFLEQYADESVLKKLRKQFKGDRFSSNLSSSDNSASNLEDSQQEEASNLPLISFESQELSSFSTTVDDNKITSWDFDVLELEPHELRKLAWKIFSYWDLPKRFHIPQQKLESFIATSQDHYRDNPFHNFYHAVATMHSSFLVVWKSVALRLLNHLDVFSMLIAALCHDIDHPGHSQAFEINKESDLAIQYNDTAVLESHHACLTFQILKSERTSILESLPHETYRFCRKVILKCILGTDMAKHFTLIQNLTNRISQDSPGVSRLSSSASLKHSGDQLEQQKRDLTDTDEIACTAFDRDNETDRLDLMELAVHSADLSGQATSWHMAKQWGDRVIQEFKEEAEKHEKHGLTAPPFMSNINTHYDVCQLQSSFIENICLPLWEPMNEALGGLEEPVEHLRKNQEQYEQEAV